MTDCFPIGIRVPDAHRAALERLPLGAANAAIREVELWRAVEAMRYQSIKTTPMIVVGSTPQIVDFSKLLLNPLNLCCTSRKSLDEHLVCESCPTSSIPNDCDRNGTTAVSGFFHPLSKNPR
jgi:hypothetical protein